ncbi:MAG TPA: proton-conducting transporter membrane subunit, partial [Ignavibacteria bacterium]|nr:proton-conducting transporter membrane subunit [Ignavibacteria bacterium]
LWLFIFFGISFVIKVPMFPFHTWLPDAHTEAPTAGSIILAAVLLKMGTYGLLRFSMELFPLIFVSYAWLLALLGVIGIIYGALVCIAQKDIKKLVAYSSVSHMGFIMLGIAAMTVESIQGGIIQMVNQPARCLCSLDFCMKDATPGKLPTTAEYLKPFRSSELYFLLSSYHL